MLTDLELLTRPSEVVCDDLSHLNARDHFLLKNDGFQVWFLLALLFFSLKSVLLFTF